MTEPTFTEHGKQPEKVIEVQAPGMIIHDTQDALDLMATVYHQYESRRIIIHRNNLHPDFFDLRTGLAGDILQKFSNYHCRLAIVGDFTGFHSKALHDFIFESNKNKQILFTADVPAALEMLR